MTDSTNPTSPEHPRGGHEPSEIRGRPAVMIAIAFIAMLIVVELVVLIVRNGFLRHEAKDDAAPTPLVAQRSPPPEPRLQPSVGHPAMEWEDLAAMRAREDAILKQYGWVDRPAGVARIPVQRAIDMLAQPAEKKP